LRAIEDSLVRAASAEPGTANLIGLLHPLKLEHKILPSADRQLIRARAKEISSQHWAGEAVASVIAAVCAGMAAAVMVATSAAVM
ncbi:MAG: GPP34 family phosphoprotein, partial [Angustibacter sp.]